MSEETAFLIIWTFCALAALLCISFRWPGKISLVWRRALYAVFILILIVNALKAAALITRLASNLSGVR